MSFFVVNQDVQTQNNTRIKTNKVKQNKNRETEGNKNKQKKLR